MRSDGVFFPVLAEVLVKIRAVARLLALATLVAGSSAACVAQSIPATVGETLSGKRVKPAGEVRGRAVILVAGFSHDGGVRCGAWMKTIESDPALKDVPVLELAMLEKAPGIIRGVIKSGMRKGVSAAEQDRIVVMTQDQPLWEKFFGVGDDKDPYVLLLNAQGEVVWHGHGQAADLEPKLRGAVKQ